MNLDLVPTLVRTSLYTSIAGHSTEYMIPMFSSKDEDRRTRWNHGYQPGYAEVSLAHKN